MNEEKNYIKFDKLTGKTVAFFRTNNLINLPDVVEIEDTLGPDLLNYIVDLNTKIPTKSLAHIIENKVSEIKSKSSRLLADTDWEILRHHEQKELNTKTSLTDAEYNLLLTKRQKIRDASNVIESQIRALADIDSISAYDVKNNSFWDG